MGYIPTAITLIVGLYFFLIKRNDKYTPIKVADIKNKQNETKMSNNKSWWVGGETGTLVFPGRDVNWCRHCGKHFSGSSKVQHRITT